MVVWKAHDGGVLEVKGFFYSYGEDGDEDGGVTEVYTWVHSLSLFLPLALWFCFDFIFILG